MFPMEVSIKRGRRDRLVPHVYRRLNSGEWVLEKRDKYLEKKLVESYETITRRFPMSSARMGKCFHNNRTMNLFDSLGIKIDSTALPSRKRNDTKRFLIGRTHQLPYTTHSKTDYRIQGKGKDRLNIIEVPMSTIKIKTSYDRVPLDRYLNISFHINLLRDYIKKLVRNGDVVVAPTHPYEIIPIYSKKHPLISFSMKNAKRVLLTIIKDIKECERINRPYKFITYIRNSRDYR